MCGREAAAIFNRQLKNGVCINSRYQKCVDPVDLEDLGAQRCMYTAFEEPFCSKMAPMLSVLRGGDSNHKQCHVESAAARLRLVMQHA